MHRPHYPRTLFCLLLVSPNHCPKRKARGGLVLANYYSWLVVVFQYASEKCLSLISLAWKPDTEGIFGSKFYCILYCIWDFFACFSRSDSSIQYHRIKPIKCIKWGFFWIFPAFLDFSGFWISRTVKLKSRVLSAPQRFFYCSITDFYCCVKNNWPEFS